jgi:hypothetical protein
MNRPAPTQPADTTESTREVLAALLEAIDLPAPRTLGDHTAYSTILEQRIIGVLPAVRTFLHDVEPADGWCADQVRERAAATPVTYRTW